MVGLYHVEHNPKFDSFVTDGVYENIVCENM